MARYLGKYGSQGVSKAVIISGVPPYLLKTADNPRGVDAAVFDGIQKTVAADRYVFFTEFFKNFHNTDLLLGKRVSEQAVQPYRPAGTLQAVPPPPLAWRVSRPGTRTSARTWLASRCRRW